MTEQEFHRIVEFMKNRNGIDLSRKKVIVQGRLDNYLRTNGYDNYSQYMDYVENDYTGKEVQNLVDILTTNHTYFMREYEQIDYFREFILPELKQRKNMEKDFRIWSAACSSGEEPYMIAMTIKDFLGLDYNKWDTTVLATDISKKVLSIAIKGVYTDKQLETVPLKWKKMNFNKVGEQEYEVTDEIKKRVLFRQFNLMNQIQFKKKLDVIFLRNVMIYFDEATKRQVINRMYDYLEKGGYLIIGCTESISSGGSEFSYVRPSIYQKR